MTGGGTDNVPVWAAIPIAIVGVGGLIWYGNRDPDPAPLPIQATAQSLPVQSPADARLEAAAERLAVAGEAAKRAQAAADNKQRPKLFDPPTGWTCTRADGEKLLLAIAAMKKVVTECAAPREVSLAPECMAFLVEHHAQLGNIFKQVEDLPMPTTPRSSGNESWDQVGTKVDAMSCCSCGRTGKDCRDAAQDLAKGEQNIRNWMRAIGKINDEECISSTYQRRIDPHRY